MTDTGHTEAKGEPEDMVFGLARCIGVLYVGHWCTLVYTAAFPKQDGGCNEREDFEGRDGDYFTEISIQYGAPIAHRDFHGMRDCPSDPLGQSVGLSSAHAPLLTPQVLLVVITVIRKKRTDLLTQKGKKHATVQMAEGKIC